CMPGWGRAGTAAAPSIVFGKLLARQGLHTPRFQFLLCAVTEVGLALGLQSLGVLLVEGQACALEDRTFIPVQPHPLQAVQDGLDRLRRRPLAIGIFNPEDEDSFFMSGKKPVKEGRTDPPDMEVASRAGSKPDSNWTHRVFPVIFLRHWNLI